MRALVTTLTEMYIQGVSTRKVAAITERLYGSEISSTQVSRAATLPDEALGAWRNRPLGTMIYLYLDALYEKVRLDGQIREAVVLIASFVNLEGKRQILGMSVSLSEQELHWRDFLQSLVERGLNGAELIISDAHVGLQAARKAVFSGVPWQRCQFHLKQNASQYVPRQSMKKEMAADIHAVFNSPDQELAELQLGKIVEKYAHSASKLADWLESNIPDGLTCAGYLSHPPGFLIVKQAEVVTIMGYYAALSQSSFKLGTACFTTSSFGNIFFFSFNNTLNIGPNLPHYPWSPGSFQT